MNTIIKVIFGVLVLIAIMFAYRDANAGWYGEAGVGVGTGSSEAYKDSMHVGINADVIYTGTVRGGYKFPTSEDYAKFKIEPAYIRLDKPFEDENIISVNFILCIGDC